MTQDCPPSRQTLLPQPSMPLFNSFLKAKLEFRRGHRPTPAVPIPKTTTKNGLEMGCSEPFLISLFLIDLFPAPLLSLLLIGSLPLWFQRLFDAPSIASFFFARFYP